MKKECLRCGTVENIENFNKDKSRKDGRHPYCRECQREISKPYFDSHKEHARVKSIEWYKNNKDKVKEYSSSDEVKKRKREYMRQYRILNKDRKRENARNYENNRVKQDINYRILNSLRKRLGSAIKGNQKKGSAVTDLGCSIEEFKKYLESKFEPGMSWDNWGIGYDKWQIDHIKALCLFDLQNRDEFLKACHYTNLQPLWYKDHITKTESDIKKKGKLNGTANKAK